MSGSVFNRGRALEYIRARGNDIEKARIDCIISGIKPSSALQRSLANKQNQDGGFPFQGLKGRSSTLSDTAFTLVWLDDLGLMHTEISLRALDFIASRQRADGSWDEDPAIIEYQPPPWMKPGETAVVVFSTASALFWLVTAGKAERAPQGLQFLERHQAPSGAYAGFRHNTWLAVAVTGMLSGWDAPAVRRGLDFLSGIPGEQWITSQISWMLWAFLKGGAPLENSFFTRMYEQLLRRQKNDGSFLAEDGEEYAVNATIEALKVDYLFKHGDQGTGSLSFPWES